METQTDNGDCLYLLTVFSHSVSYADSVCFFTNYDRAINVKTELQEKIDAYMIEQKEYWKGRVWVNPKYVRDYKGHPTAVVLKVPYSELDQVTPEYRDIVEGIDNPRPLKELPSTGRGCWFDFLKSEKKGYDEKIGAICESFDALNKGTQTRFPALYVVTDYFINNDYLNSKLVGVFTDPALAQDAQAKVGANYGLDVVFGTWGDNHFVELAGFADDKQIDPEEISYYRMNISTK